MPNLHPNSTNYVHSYEPNTSDLTMAMTYNSNGEPCIRVLTNLVNGGISFSGNYNDLSNKPVLFDPSNITQSMLPDTDVAYDLGSPTNQWRDLYLSGSSIFLGGTVIALNDAAGIDLPANTTIDGAVVTSFSGNYSDLSNRPTIPADVSDLTDVNNLLQSSGNGSSYTLPAASNSILGGIKVGTGLVIDVDGVVSVTVDNFSGSYNDLTDKPTIPTDISDLTDNTNLLAGAGGDGSYTLPTATGSVLGGIKIGTGLAIDVDGVVSVTVDTFSGDYNDLTNKPTLFDGQYASLTGTPTTLSFFTNDSGYITGYTVTQSDVTQHQSALLITESQISDLGNYLTTVAFADLTSKPTTLSGYGITDAYTKTEVNSAITTSINDLVNGAPELLDTLGELANAISSNENFITSIDSSISLKANTADLAPVATSGSYEDLTDKPNFNLTEDDLFAIAIIF